MMSSGVIRKVALIVGAASIVGTGALTACSSDKDKDRDKPAETSQPTSAPAVAPTEKANLGSFAPSVTARPAPTALPGNVITGG